MKKSVLFIIDVIYFISIFVVSFFGMSISIDQFKVYINKVEITNYQEIDPYYGKTTFLEFDDLEGASFFVEYKVGPENATNKSALKFSLTNNVFIDEFGNESPIAQIDQKGELFFLRQGTVKVVLESTDGLSKSDYMWIDCYKLD